MDIQHYIADQTERMVESYCQFIDSTYSDRLNWTPVIDGSAPVRSILEQVYECIHTNHRVAALLRGSAMPEVEEFPVVTTSAEAKSALRESGTDLAEAIRTLSEADLDASYQHPRAVMTGWNLIIMPMRNMSYHAGQLNMFQMLYGDAEFHVPTNWR